MDISCGDGSVYIGLGRREDAISLALREKLPVPLILPHRLALEPYIVEKRLRSPADEDFHWFMRAAPSIRG